MKKLTLALAAAGLLSVGTVAHAEQFSYTFVELGYASANLDFGGGDVDLDGYGVLGSYQFKGTPFFVTAGAATAELDVPVSNKINTYDIGIGARTSLSKTVDVYLNLSAVRADIKVAGFSDSDTGYRLITGLRFAATDKIELGATVAYTDISDGNGTILNLNARYNLTKNASVGVLYAVGEAEGLDITGYGASFRYAF